MDSAILLTRDVYGARSMVPGRLLGDLWLTVVAQLLPMFILALTVTKYTHYTASEHNLWCMYIMYVL